MYAAKIVQVLPFDMLLVEYESKPGEPVKMDKKKVRLYDATLITKGSVDAKPAQARGGKGGKGGKGAKQQGKGGKGKGGKGKGRATARS